MPRSPVLPLAAMLSLGLLTTTLLAQDATAEKVQLAWKLKEGQKIHYVVQQKGDFGSQQASGDTNQTLDLEWRVTSLDKEGRAKVEQVVTRMRMTLGMPAPIGKVTVDSKANRPRDPFGQAIAEVMGKIVGKKFVVEMTPQGLAEPTKPAEPAKPTGRPKRPAKGPPAAGNVTPEADAWQAVAASASLPLPGEPIAPGHRWSREAELDIPQVGKQKTTTNYHYVGVESVGGKQLHKIEVTAEIKPADEAKKSQMKVTNHTGTGVLYFDAEAGLLDSGSMKQSTTIDVGGGAIGGGVYDVEAETSIKREE